MLALTNGFFEVNRAEAGRRGNDHHVGELDRFLVSVQADELGVLRHRQTLRTILELALNLFQAALEAVLERIRDRHELHIAIRAQRLCGSATTTATGADQRDADGVTGRSAKGEAFNGQRAQQGAAGHSGGSVLQKTPARESRIGRGWLGIVHVLVS